MDKKGNRLNNSLQLQQETRQMCMYVLKETMRLVFISVTLNQILDIDYLNSKLCYEVLRKYNISYQNYF